MKRIKLSGQKSSQYFAIVDDEDYEFLTQFRWHYMRGYAVRNGPYVNGKRKPIRMQRVITNCPDQLVVDHKDMNKLNNQKSNLRICTKSENSCNQNLYSANKSGYRGVAFHTKAQKYRAKITINGEEKWLGYFLDPKMAALAYDKEAKKYHGEFARLNLVQGGLT